MTADLAALERALSRTALAMRVQAGLDWASIALSASALGVGIWQLSTRHALGTRGVAAVALTTSIAGVCGLLWPVAIERVAQAIDRTGELEGRVLAAVMLRREPAGRQSAFMHAALRDAGRHAHGVSAQRAAQLHAPRAWWQALFALLVCLFARPKPELAQRHSEPARPAIVAPLLDRDELLGLRAEFAPPPVDSTLSPTLRAQLDAYEALLTQLAQPGLPADAAVARALAIEAALPLALRAERSEHDDALLHKLSAELARARPELAEALRRELSEAAHALSRLSAELRADELPASERAQLAAALEHARARERERLAQATREEKSERLLRPAQTPAQGERSVLSPERDARRELETLQRERPRPSDRRELQKLSRELAEAGAALAEQRREQAADALEQASTDLTELHARERESAQARELARAVAQLRELLQRRAQAKQERPEPAHGAQPSGEQGAAEPSAATTSAGSRRRAFQRRADGEDDDESDAGAASRPSDALGQGAEREASTATTVLLPGVVQQRVDVVESASSGGGSEHDERKAATPSPPRRDIAHEDHLLRGALGAGPVRSQVIRGAAGAGFASSAYRKVYGDYRAHAETVLERDRVPSGARFQVRRYFQLVRPREGQDAHD